MADITLKVSDQKMKEVSAAVSSLVQSLTNDFDTMQSLVEKTNGYWVGAAGDKYRSEFKSKKSDTDSILEYLKKYPKDLLEQAGIYSAAESRNVQQFEQLKSDYID